MKENNSPGYRLNWQTLRRDWPLWILMAGLIVFGCMVYPHLPDKIPSHWNIYGQVDSYSSRASGAFIRPLVTVLGIYLLLLFIPLIDPRRENYPRFFGAYTFMRWALVLFMSALYLITILAALGYAIDVDIYVKAGVAILFTIIGNFMGQFRHNYFVGIKTPWTLANEEVWQLTHRLGGRIWVAGGLLCLLVSPFKGVWSAYAYFTALMVMVLVPMAYSYIVYTRLKNG